MKLNLKLVRVWIGKYYIAYYMRMFAKDNEIVLLTESIDLQ